MKTMDMRQMIGEERVEKGLWWRRAWNLVEGCSKVSAGCDHCWGESAAHMRSRNPNAKVRAANDGLTDAQGHWNGHVREREDLLDLPERTKKPTVFSIWMDLFHPGVDYFFQRKVFHRMLSCKQHVFCVLTKRPERIVPRLYTGAPPMFGDDEALSNVILMTTAENQEQADKRIPELLKVNAPEYGNGGWTLGVSVEPCLEGIEFSPDKAPYLYFNGPEPTWADCLDWIVMGGESGPGARPMHPDWARLMRDQCWLTAVPFFFKQWGEWAPCPDEEWHGLGPTGKPKQLALSPKGETAGGFLSKELGMERAREGWLPVQRIGKKAAGRMLDGVIHNGFPAMDAMDGMDAMD